MFKIARKSIQRLRLATLQSVGRKGEFNER
jgi:hypothetical protein